MSFVHTPARLAAAGVLAALGLAWMPSAASADALSGVTGAVGLVRPVAETASTVVLSRDGDIATYPTQLLSMQHGATLVPGYSLSPDTVVPRSSRYSDSVAPSALGLDQLRKITWILASVPTLPALPTSVPALPGGVPALPGGVPALPGAVPALPGGVPALPGGVPGLSGGLPALPGGLPSDLPAGENGLPELPVLPLPSGITPQQRAAATQAAIWHYSAGTDLVPGRNLPVVRELYDKLTGLANPGLALPGPTLMSAPDADAFGDVRGMAGQLVGPYTVDPALSTVLMTLDGPAGVRLVDAARQPLHTFHGGDHFFLDVPDSAPAGLARITALGTPRTALGRVVRGVTSGDPGQLLVVADRRPLSAQQTSVVRWGASGLGRDVGVSPTCVAEGIGVELDNARRQLPLKALVDQRPVTVPAGATKVVPVRVPEGEHYTIPVSDGAHRMTLSGVRHCAAAALPVLTTAPDCAHGGMGLTIVNDAALRDAVYTVNGQAVRVARQTSKTVRVPVAEGARYRIQVLGQDGFSRAFTGVRSCAAETRLAANAAAASAPAAALPVTGAALGGIIVGGIALFGAGAVALVITRRRRTRPTV